MVLSMLTSDIGGDEDLPGPVDNDTAKLSRYGTNDDRALCDPGSLGVKVSAVSAMKIHW